MKKDKPIIVKKYGDKYKITICRFDIWGEKTKNGDAKKNVNDEKLDYNISRAKGKVFEYAKCNEWQYFATLTLDRKKRNRYDLKEYIKELGQFIRNERKRTGTDIKYLLIPEQHKDGAWHMHGYFDGICPSDVTENAQGYYQWQRYSQMFGYCSLDYIKHKDKCDNYITKYISKDMGGKTVEKNKKLYYSSKGLSTAEVVCEKYTNVSLVKPDYENDFVQVKWCSTLSEVQAHMQILGLT